MTYGMTQRVEKFKMDFYYTFFSFFLNVSLFEKDCMILSIVNDKNKN